MKFLIIFSSLILAINSFRFDIDLNKREKFDFKSLKKINEIYKDCGSETGVITNITITGCTKAPCVFVRGNSYSIDLQFTSKVDTKKVSNKVYGIIAKLPVPFPLPNEDGCSLGITCPVKNGQKLEESVTLPVQTEYPKISLYVKWEVVDDNNKQMVCFLFPVVLQ